MLARRTQLVWDQCYLYCVDRVIHGYETHCLSDGDLRVGLGVCTLLRRADVFTAANINNTDEYNTKKPDGVGA